MHFKISEQQIVEPWRHPRLTQAVTYYARTLRIPHPKELDIKLLLSKNKRLVNKGEHGNVRALRESHINGSPHQFKITIQSDMPWTWTLQTFAHEMVHVWQYATGKLKLRWHNGEWQNSWNGGAWAKHGSIPYRERPWEIEALSKEKKLLNGFFDIENKDGPSLSPRVQLHD